MAIKYVDNTNGDDNANGDIGTPWETLAKANASVSAGDIIYVRVGTYFEPIVPNTSGSVGNYITYANYPGEVVTISGVVTAINLVNRSYINIDGIDVSESSGTTSAGHWVGMKGGNNNSHHNIIQNCEMHQTVTRNAGWAGIYMEGANYNIIRGNIFGGRSGNPTGDLISIRAVCEYNLFEDNEFHYSCHQCMSFQGNGANTTHNVIRRNIIHNPFHTGMALFLSANGNLVDENIYVDCGEEHGDNVNGSAQDQAMGRDEHKGLQIGSSELIIRRNLFINNGRNPFVDYGGVKISDNNRIYNNTYYENYFGVWSNSDGGANNTYYKNNIFDASRTWSFYHNNDSSNVYVDTNNVRGATRFLTPGNWTNNIDQASGFTNVGTRNFTLTEGSNMIDAGAFLTTTNGSDTASTTLIIDDARYFMDGWGIITGDTIQLEGQTTTAIITDITGNTLTLDTALTWTDGIGVALAYSGDAPDLGALEFTEVVDPPEIPIPTIDDWIEVEDASGVVTAPMVLVADGAASGGYYIHSPTNNAGTAFYTFDVTTAATYRIKASVYAVDDGADSFFVQIDNDPEDIWDLFRGDIGYHGAWDVDIVSYRGTGTWGDPQYNPYTIYLDVGLHTIRFRGRDAGARLDRFYLEADNTVSLARGAGRGVIRGVLIGVV